MSRPQLMGILNITPDSFSDGGRFQKLDAALYRAEQLIQQGADIIDIGGESTRPGAVAVDLHQELQRVIPTINAIKTNFAAKISVDTTKPQVMQAAIEAGAYMINDVNALQATGSLQILAASKAKICLMHMQGQPRTMQLNPQYNDVIAEVKQFLHQRVTTCLAAGINADRIYLDVGFGFGKSLEHNLILLRHLAEFKTLGYPLLVGLSRKSMLGQVVDKPVDKRLFAGLAATAVALMNGAQIIRTHDVAETLDVIKMVHAVML